MRLSRKGATLGRAIKPVASERLNGMSFALGRMADARENGSATLGRLLEYK